MKHRTTIMNLTTQLVLLTSLALICSNAFADTHYFVQMKLNPQQDELVITTNKKDTGSCKTTWSKKGCVRAEKGVRDIKVDFLLAGKNKCELDGGDHWKLNSVMLGGKDLGSKPDSDDQWGGFQTDTNVMKDFDFLDAAKGTLNPAGPASDRRITISDKNGYEYIVWYKVEAICVDRSGNQVGDAIYTDPRIENEG
jgi:hypothetical protein